MTDQDKELLLKDLSARVPYGVKIEGYKLPCITLNSDWLHFMYTHQEFALRRPYLRPISSMTEEERNELSHYDNSVQRTDFFYSHHIDCRYIIEKGLALEAPEGMYK